MKKLPQITVEGFCGLVIFLFLILSCYSFLTFFFGPGDYILFFTGKKVTGEIIDITKVKECGKSSCFFAYTPLIQFKDQTGLPVTFYSTFHQDSAGNYRVGQTVVVDYDTGHPTRAIIDDPNGIKSEFIFFVVISIFLLVSGVSMFRSKKI